MQYKHPEVDVASPFEFHTYPFSQTQVYALSVVVPLFHPQALHAPLDAMNLFDVDGHVQPFTPQFVKP